LKKLTDQKTAINFDEVNKLPETKFFQKGDTVSKIDARHNY